MGQARRPRPRVRPAAARAAADVRGRLPGHVQGHRRRVRALVPASCSRSEDPRDQPDDGHRRLRRHLRPVAVHRRHHRVRPTATSRTTCSAPGRAARAVRGDRDGRGLRLRRPRTAHLARQRRRDDRRLLPHAAGHARGRDRHHRVRALSYGTIYTTKLLRRGTDIDRAAPWRARADLKLTDDARAAPAQPPAPLPGYHVAEITITENSPAAGRKLDDVSWPPASIAVSVLRVGSLYPAEQGITLAAGDRVSLLIPATLDSQPQNAEALGRGRALPGSSPAGGNG